MDTSGDESDSDMLERYYKPIKSQRHHRNRHHQPHRHHHNHQYKYLDEPIYYSQEMKQKRSSSCSQKLHKLTMEEKMAYLKQTSGQHYSNDNLGDIYYYSQSTTNSGHEAANNLVKFQVPKQQLNAFNQSCDYVEDKKPKLNYSINENYSKPISNFKSNIAVPQTSLFYFICWIC